MKDNFISIQEPNVSKGMFALKEKGSIDYISLKNIVRLKSDKNYTVIYTKEGKTVVSSRTLFLFEKLLAKNPEFVRVNRSEVVNLEHLSIEPSGIWFKFSSPSSVKISRRRQPHVAARIMVFSETHHSLAV
jgi:two-component system, LytTR family, response regulator